MGAEPTQHVGVSHLHRDGPPSYIALIGVMIESATGHSLGQEGDVTGMPKAYTCCLCAVVVRFSNWERSLQSMLGWGIFIAMTLFSFIPHQSAPESVPVILFGVKAGCEMLICVGCVVTVRFRNWERSLRSMLGWGIFIVMTLFSFIVAGLIQNLPLCCSGV
jgi:hypothetical protein